MSKHLAPPRGVAVQLNCGVWQLIPSEAVARMEERNGVMVYPGPPPVRCPIHDGMHHIVRVRDCEWLAECDTCQWYRWTGADKRLAQRARGLHRRADKFTHRVRVYYTAVPGMEYYRLVAPEHLWRESG